MKEMIWEYEDFEFDNRVSNLMWTICGDYEESMNASEKTNLSKNIALYFGVTAGGRRKFVNWKLVNQYVTWRSIQGFSKKNLQWLLHRSINMMVVKKLSKERPGIEDIQEVASNEMVNLLGKPVSEKFKDKIEFEIFKHYAGIKPEISNQVFVSDILNTSNSKDTKELIEAVDELYIKHFKPEKFKELDFESINIHRDLMDTEKYIEDAVKALLSKEQFKDQQEDQNEVMTISNAGMMEIDEESLKEMQNNLTLFCGESYLTEYQVRRLENRLCKGPHLDCQLHYTDGILRGNSHSQGKKRTASKEFNKNYQAYRKNFLVNERNIRHLRDVLIATLQAERSKYQIASDSGKINAPKLWRVNRGVNNKLFTQTQSNDKGEFVVDLLIDSSFSQKGREDQVATQAYIVARALIEAEIPCRVNGFYTFLNYTVIKRFRDYDDPLAFTDNIFEYLCESSNRDGLAIKGVVTGLNARNEENKILIVLSDGKPNDVQIRAKNSLKKRFRGQRAYSGGLAIGDTAKEVRLARQQGIFVLGIFTGNESDLYAEKLIYGKDFVYTRNINYFSKIVGTYLKRVITL